MGNLLARDEPQSSSEGDNGYFLVVIVSNIVIGFSLKKEGSLLLPPASVSNQNSPSVSPGGEGHDFQLVQRLFMGTDVFRAIKQVVWAYEICHRQYPLNQSLPLPGVKKTTGFYSPAYSKNYPVPLGISRCFTNQVAALPPELRRLLQ